ncbi:MAG TPA: AbrB/MazE/SpoVT family DNA-binding domain-containing protein [Chloroflexi bacterium]|nr:AbrB/MazE/SpoVT family DNA-binding domain-containing protein [Chloroflexota bacterium]
MTRPPPTHRGVITLPKKLRDSYHLRGGANLTLLDLGGVFVLSPPPSQIDTLADQVAEQCAADRQSLQTMLQALREEYRGRGG